MINSYTKTKELDGIKKKYHQREKKKTKYKKRGGEEILSDAMFYNEFSYLLNAQ